MKLYSNRLWFIIAINLRPPYDSESTVNCQIGILSLKQTRVIDSVHLRSSLLRRLADNVSADTQKIDRFYRYVRGFNCDWKFLPKVSHS